MLLRCSTKDTFNIVRRWKKLHVTLPCVQQLNFRQSSCFNWMNFTFLFNLVLNAKKKATRVMFDDSVSK